LHIHLALQLTIHFKTAHFDHFCADFLHINAIFLIIKKKKKYEKLLCISLIMKNY
jgi:hypothetical protein